MWPLPPFNKRYVTIHFSPHHIICSWFQEDNRKADLNGFNATILENLEMERLIIFNPSHVDQIIQAFLEKYQLHHAFSIFCLSGPTLHEQFITLDTASPAPEAGVLHPTSKNDDRNKLIWDYSYLYPSQDGKFVFYAAGLTREILFQYQLLAIRNNLNLIAISPATIGFLALYQQYKGTQFRHSQLGIELTQHNNNASQLFNEHMINEIIHIQPEISINQKDIHALLASAGLFFMRNNINA